MSATSGRPRWDRALVTGASSGIGEAFARRLAAEGTDLVLVARDGDRLDALAEELTAAHGVSAEVLSADLSSPVSRAAVEKRLSSGEQVDLLVNNAGFATTGAFVDLAVSREEQQVQVNVLAVLRLCAAVLPGMVERGAGHIVNVASISGVYPSPRTATYGATKAFVCAFTDALHEELRGTGVVVSAVLPGLTRTDFQRRAGRGEDRRVPRFAWTSADEVAAASLAAAAAGRSRVVPGAANKVLVGLAGLLPARARARLGGQSRGTRPG